MKLVLDSNIFIAGFATRGTCDEIVKNALIHHTVYISELILKEIRKTLKQKLRFSQDEIDARVSMILPFCVFVKKITPLKKRVSRDKNDDPILALALTTEVDAIFSGDKDLYVLKQFEHIPILQPKDFWEYEALKVGMRDEVG